MFTNWGAWASVTVCSNDILKDGETSVLVAATDVEPHDDWSPFIRFAIDEHTIRLESLGRSTITCEPDNRSADSATGALQEALGRSSMHGR